MIPQYPTTCQGDSYVPFFTQNTLFRVRDPKWWKEENQSSWQLDYGQKKPQRWGKWCELLGTNTVPIICYLGNARGTPVHVGINNTWRTKAGMKLLNTINSCFLDQWEHTRGRVTPDLDLNNAQAASHLYHRSRHWQWPQYIQPQRSCKSPWSCHSKQ